MILQFLPKDQTLHAVIVGQESHLGMIVIMIMMIMIRIMIIMSIMIMTLCACGVFISKQPLQISRLLGN